MEQLRQDSQLQEYFLRLPAKSALKSLQILCLGDRASEIMGFQHDYGPDRTSILRISLAVRRGDYRPEEMELLDNNRLLDDHIEQFMYNLDDDRMLKLALLTWHFDASSQKPYEELLRFFSLPDEECSEVYTRICERYSNYTGRRVSQEEFRRGFLELLGFLRFVFQGEWSVI
ncbi:hypothetical protein ASPBRDRAFT_31914 [Aspergillus brasiliensis CBS 101740]|uniref:Uncharacterized protein n=1 Tax=Aspergillus brasiliensis (strain CBS 101740 / IMI 381727 / IBT 21946) TaxID=767769 RepID=A0A1L9UEE5_ASPBC|nr:hypothetical protein ASPBRDRAFT_31914 [Aspergillus brasiliensis CBS 101740]